jgi:hypothetical protein
MAAEDDLPRMWAAVTDRMAYLGLIRGLGNVPAEIAERFVNEYLGGELASRGTTGYDLVADGQRVQVKCLRMTDELRNTVGNFPLNLGFDVLVIVRFEYDMTVRDAWHIDGAALPSLLTKGGRLTLTRRVIESASVHQISREELLNLNSDEA